MTALRLLVLVQVSTVFAVDEFDQFGNFDHAFRKNVGAQSSSQSDNPDYFSGDFLKKIGLAFGEDVGADEEPLEEKRLLRRTGESDQEAVETHKQESEGCFII